eukprot:642669-Hanusia_phi.AAC.1
MLQARLEAHKKEILENRKFTEQMENLIDEALAHGTTLEEFSRRVKSSYRFSEQQLYQILQMARQEIRKRGPGGDGEEEAEKLEPSRKLTFQESVEQNTSRNADSSDMHSETSGLAPPTSPPAQVPSWKEEEEEEGRYRQPSHGRVEERQEPSHARVEEWVRGQVKREHVAWEANEILNDVLPPRTLPQVDSPSSPKAKNAPKHDPPLTANSQSSMRTASRGRTFTGSFNFPLESRRSGGDTGAEIMQIHSPKDTTRPSTAISVASTVYAEDRARASSAGRRKLQPRPFGVLVDARPATAAGRTRPFPLSLQQEHQTRPKTSVQLRRIGTS